MGKAGNIFFKITDTVTEKVGRAVSLAALLIMLIIAIEVIARYAFASPTTWAWPTNKQLFGVLSLFGGAYALLHGRHIRVEVLYERFGSRLKLVSAVLYAITFLFFIAILVWQGYLMAEMSVKNREAMHGIIYYPLYPLKALVPVAALLFFSQGIANFLRGKT